MAWTPPRTWSADELIDETILNTHVRDNLAWLKDPPTGIATLSTAITTTSTSWTNVTGLSVTLTTYGGTIMVGWIAVTNMSTGTATHFNVAVDGVDQASSTDGYTYSINSPINTVSPVILLEGIAAGTHTFQLRWKNNSGATTTLYAESSISSLKMRPTFWVRES